MMILNPELNEKKFLNISPMSRGSVFEMDDMEITSIGITTDDMVVSSSTDSRSEDANEGERLLSCNASSHLLSDQIQFIKCETDHCQSNVIKNEILSRRSKSSNSPLNSKMPRLKIGRMTKEPFLKYFGLVPNAKADSIKQEHKDVTDIDCEIIAVEGFEDVENMPITSPRTPHSLMAQLSRDHEGSARKRLFSLSESGNDPEEIANRFSWKPTIQGSLLGIDFSSFLGQRVRKHVKAESTHLIRDVESYCTTTLIKNDFMEKLRFRQADYPVTFRKKKKGSNRHRRCHEYKFNACERKEFMKVLRTGLNKDGRRLKRQMQKLSICIERLSPKVIKEWTQPKPKIQPTLWLDDDIGIVQVDPPSGLTKGYSGQNFPKSLFSASSSNIHVSRNTYSLNNLTFEPRTQFLVKKVEANGTQYQQNAFLKQSANSQHIDKNSASFSRRKQNLSVLRTEPEDEITIKRCSSNKDSLLNSKSRTGPTQNGSADNHSSFPFNYGLVSRSRPLPMSSAGLYQRSVGILQSTSSKQSVIKQQGGIASAQASLAKQCFGSGVVAKNVVSGQNCFSRPGMSGRVSENSVAVLSTCKDRPVSALSKTVHKTDPQSRTAPLRANNQTPHSVKQNHVNAHLTNLNHVKPCSSDNKKSLTISSVFSLNGTEDKRPLGRVNIEIGQLGALTGGTKDSPLVFPTGIKANQFVHSHVPNIQSKPSAKVTKMTEYVVERNIDSDTNEVVEIICIEDES